MTQPTEDAPTRPAWERVPKPARIRRSVHLGNMPVPWVTCWSAKPFHPEHGPLGISMSCHCTPGVGKPGLAGQCPVRQRRAMIERRCNACGDRITGVALFAGVFHTALVDEGRTPITAEAPVHPVCLAYSALVCPRLHRVPDRCMVVAVRGAYPLIDQWMTSHGGIESHHYQPHDTPRAPNAALEYVYARLNLPGLTAITLGDWMYRHAPQPYRALWLAELAHRTTDQTTAQGNPS